MKKLRNIKYKHINTLIVPYKGLNPPQHPGIFPLSRSKHII